MFKCALTGKLTKPGEKAFSVVVEKRDRIYLNEEGEEVSRGWEIVKEIRVSEEGYNKWIKMNEEMGDH
jgi:hypothetical protein